MKNLLKNSLQKIFEEFCTSDWIRSVERGGSIKTVWDELETAGFLDALVAEKLGGAGLTLDDVFPVAFLIGQFSVPMPIAQTMVSRAILTHAGISPPPGAITFANAQISAEYISCNNVIEGLVSDWFLIQNGSSYTILSKYKANIQHTGIRGSLNAHIIWPIEELNDSQAFECNCCINKYGAMLTAAMIAGALDSIFSRTLEYANARTQFGRAIGKYQVIQHQISVMAESVYAASAAAQLGFISHSLEPELVRVAVAKSRASEAVLTAVSIAHAVHGAIGITEEYDLQLSTRRLNDWRINFGSEAYWNSQLGKVFLANPEIKILDFARVYTGIDAVH